MASSSSRRRHPSLFSASAAAALALALAIITGVVVVVVVGAQEEGEEQYYTTVDGHDCFRDLDSTIRSAFDLAASHPDLVTVSDVGDSHIRSSGTILDADADYYGGLSSDGYDIYAVNVTAPWGESSHSSSSASSSGGVGGNKGILMITSGVHAREYAPPELALRFAEYLAGRYGIDPDVTYILRRTEVHLILHVNPDGRYVAEKYPETSQRKNMNGEEASCGSGGGIGVDINRNFDFMWGDLGGATSDDPCADTYHGPSPESESETQAVSIYPYYYIIYVMRLCVR